MSLTTLHITNAWHPSSGGVKTFYGALLDAANEEGRRLIMVVPSDRSSVEPVGRFGRIHFVAAPAAPAFDSRYRVLYPHTYLPPFAGALHRVLADERPDVVEICDKYTLPYLAMLVRKGYLRGVPRPALVALTAERFDDNMAAYLHNGRAAMRFTRWYLRQIYGPPFDLHLANSDYTASELRAALPDRPAAFIRVCPPGVVAEDFSPGLRSPDLRASLLRSMGGTPASTLLLYAGRLSPEKNLPLLTDTMMHLNERGGDFRLVIAGDGPDSARLRSLMTGPLAGRILLCGSQPRKALAALYASADVFVHPNPKEPFGIAPLEAMASGVPVVVPAAGGVLTYAHTGNAWLAEPDPTAFAAAIRSAARGNIRRTGAALATVRQFSLAHAARRHFDAYDAAHAAIAGRNTHLTATSPHGSAPSLV
jgi:alpha-1,6-mannosyltransferase